MDFELHTYFNTLYALTCAHKHNPLYNNCSVLHMLHDFLLAYMIFCLVRLCIAPAFVALLFVCSNSLFNFISLYFHCKYFYSLTRFFIYFIRFSFFYTHTYFRCSSAHSSVKICTNSKSIEYEYL